MDAAPRRLELWPVRAGLDSGSHQLVLPYLCMRNVTLCVILEERVSPADIYVPCMPPKGSKMNAWLLYGKWRIVDGRLNGLSS